jgi:tetratricopeptide (TPR) repeat protein
VTDYYDLGTYNRGVTTTSADAQRWFDRGLVWTYAYNHGEAISCFEKALEADLDCAMAHWGIAYCIGPNYNKPWDAFEEDEKTDALAVAQDSIASAMHLRAEVTPVERALIEALPHRYPEDPSETDFAPWNDAYADAMRKVHKAFANDIDVCCLFAEAIMNRTPWSLWDLPSGQPAEGADTLEAIDVLETALDSLDGAWDHPGLLHMYIHLMEMSPHPERALRHGDRLATLVPDAGHLLHMPTHIDVLPQSWPTGNSWSARVARISTRCTAATTTTSRSTARCSWGSRNRRSKQQMNSSRRCPRTRCDRWRTGSSRSSR